tara:strand:- start:106 stop:321 length:216 start_codon:yes stop_codon:yes gene_type:complete
MLLPGRLPGVSAAAAPVLLAVRVWVYGRSARKSATELLQPAAVRRERHGSPPVDRFVDLYYHGQASMSILP